MLQQRARPSAGGCHLATEHAIAAECLNRLISRICLSTEGLWRSTRTGGATATWKNPDLSAEARRERRNWADQYATTGKNHFGIQSTDSRVRDARRYVNSALDQGAEMSQAK